MNNKQIIEKTFPHLKVWRRFYCSSKKNQAPQTAPKRIVGVTQQPDPQSVKNDYIGPPDAQSNLRPYVRHYDECETRLARKLRLKRIEVEEWNQDFWSKHNKRFYEEKAHFVRLYNSSKSGEISPDVMSIFYKSFLDKNKRMHGLYNLSWYLKNLDLLILDFQVFLQNIMHRKRKHSK